MLNRRPIALLSTSAACFAAAFIGCSDASDDARADESESNTFLAYGVSGDAGDAGHVAFPPRRVVGAQFSQRWDSRRFRYEITATIQLEFARLDVTPFVTVRVEQQKGRIVFVAYGESAPDAPRGIGRRDTTVVFQPQDRTTWAMRTYEVEVQSRNGVVLYKDSIYFPAPTA